MTVKWRCLLGWPHWKRYGWNQRVTDDGLAALSEFQRLQEVDLTDTPISDAGLALLSSLPELKRLDVSYTEVTAKGITTLRDFEALEVIAFDPSQITVGIVEYLRRIRTLKRVTINRQRAPGASSTGVPAISTSFWPNCATTCRPSRSR